MILYCNGDSFVAGVELGDDILPEYPGTQDFDAPTSVINLAKEWILKTQNHTHPWAAMRQELFTQIFDIERSRAFPNKISKLLNLPVINNALGGSSMDRIARTTIDSLIELKRENEDIIAIIGITEASRSELANFNECYNNEYSTRWVDMSLGYVNEGVKPLEAVRNYKLRYETDYHCQINFYKNVILLQDFCKVNHIPLFWVNPGFTNLSNSHPDTDLLNMKNYANLTCIVDMVEIARKINVNVRCPSGHHSEVVHDEVAKIIASILQESSYVQIH
jgi:hypothetical protein